MRLFAMPQRLLATCALLCFSLLGPRVSVAQKPPLVEKPRYLTTALRATALLLRDDDLLASDEQHLLRRVKLTAGKERPESSSWSPVTYPRRILPLQDGSVLLADQHAETIFRVRTDGTGEPLISGQRVLTIARDATHLYWINLGAPYLRRAPLPAPQVGRPANPPPQPPLEGLASIPDEFSDLVVEAGEVFLADVTKHSVLRLRAGGSPETFAQLPSAPSALLLTKDALFVGARDGAIYRIERTDGKDRRIVRLGAARGGVAQLALLGCFVVAGSEQEVVAFEPTRGVRVPVADAAVAGLAARADRIFYTDSKSSGVYEAVAPACPAATASGEARELTTVSPPPATPTPPEKDDDGLAHRSTAKSHTIVVSLATTNDQLARDTVRKHVERVLAEPVGSEVWARASDAQVAELRRLGFFPGYRDGVDRVRCVDIKQNPSAASRPPPAPFHEGGTPQAYLMQLQLPTHVIEALQDQLSTRNAVLLETLEPATILVSASPAVAARLTKLPFVSWMGAYGARERLLALAYSVTQLQGEGGCGKDLDAPLKALAAWIKRAPQTKIKLTAILFQKSAEWKALVRSQGGNIDGVDSEPTTIRIVVPRSAIIELAAHPALRTLELTGEPTVSAD